MVADHSETPWLGSIAGIVGKDCAYLVMGMFAFMTIAPLVWLIISSFKSTQEFRAQPRGLPHVWTLDQLPRRVEARGVRQAHRQLCHLYRRRHARDHLLLHPCGLRLRQDQVPGNARSSTEASCWESSSPSSPSWSRCSSRSPSSTSFSRTSSPSSGLMKTGKPPLLLRQPLRRAPHLHRLGPSHRHLSLSTEYIKGIPYALVEAARIDGAGYFKIFRWIILPMAVPIATTVAILNITNLWNEFALINILVSKTDLKSLPLGIFSFTRKPHLGLRQAVRGARDRHGAHARSSTSPSASRSRKASRPARSKADADTLLALGSLRAELRTGADRTYPRARGRYHALRPARCSAILSSSPRMQRRSLGLLILEKSWSRSCCSRDVLPTRPPWGVYALCFSDTRPAPPSAKRESTLVSRASAMP